eukprot:TRINITY_DN51006_c0_g1_i1.p1 TRINITY_DN51006_c0_g1~~TRINITY_DN51006_c0_g1_i1.p1  ORF type:complete len:271 (+),score=64.57 TRINITY_DN51006_c0_g1_i1:46-858(+)
MATLGWRDSGSVVLSKNEALRQEHDSDNPVKSKMQVWSRRKSPTRRKRDDKDVKEKEEADDFLMDVDQIIQLRPERRVKWLTKALMMVGKKTLKVSTFYEVIMDKKFVKDLPQNMGVQMRLQLMANDHLFSPKQQKMLQSEECHFSGFKKEKKEKVKEKSSGKNKDRDQDRDRDRERDRDEREKDRRRGDSSDYERGGRSSRKRRRSDSGSRSQSRRQDGRRQEKEPQRSRAGAKGSKANRADSRSDESREEDTRRDPRSFAPGAADLGY